MNRKEATLMGRMMQKLEDIEASNNSAHSDMKKHLVTLNGQVYNNTTFRHRIIGALKVISILVGGGGVVLFISRFLI